MNIDELCQGPTLLADGYRELRYMAWATVVVRGLQEQGLASAATRLAVRHGRSAAAHRLMVLGEPQERVRQAIVEAYTELGVRVGDAWKDAGGDVGEARHGS